MPRAENGAEVGRLAMMHPQLSRIRTPLSTDEIVERLNGATITAPLGSWLIEVYGIVDEGSDRWIQIVLAGQTERTVLLKLGYLADEIDAIASIEQWLRESTSVHAAVLIVSGSG